MDNFTSAHNLQPTSSKPAWVKLLNETSVRTIVDPKQEVVSVNFFDHVSTLLKKLSDSKILAAVVTSSDKPGVLGFVDVLDIMTFLLDALAAESMEFSEQSFRNIQWQGKAFAQESCGSLINRSKRNEMKTVDLDTSLMTVSKMFSSEIHRVGVIHNDRLVNILSQSDIIRFLATRGVYIGSQMEKPISEEGLEPLGVASVLDNLPTIDVIRFMRDKMLSGVAVVDHQGRLVANFSGSDLLGLNENNFAALTLGVKEYLFRMYGYPKSPVYVKQNDKVETVLLKMVVHQVHRVYIVDDSMKAIGVITMTDVMEFFVSAR